MHQNSLSVIHQLMMYYLCALVHDHKFMDCWWLFRINKLWIFVVQRHSHENFWTIIIITLSNANFQIPWNLILWSPPHNGCLEFGDTPIKGYCKVIPPLDLLVPPPVVIGSPLFPLICNICAPHSHEDYLNIQNIVTCQAHPVLVKKRVKCTIRFFLKIL